MASKPVESAVRSKYWRSEKDSRKEVSGQEQRRPLLSEILTNKAPPPYTLSAYMAYLSQNQCLKNLEFIMDSSRYRKHYLKMEERHGSENPISPLSDECRYVKLLFERLVDAYISANGPREVYLPADIRDPLVAARDLDLPPHPRILDLAVSCKYELMEEDLLVPFLNSVSPHKPIGSSFGLPQNLDNSRGPGVEFGTGNTMTFTELDKSQKTSHRPTFPNVRNETDSEWEDKYPDRELAWARERTIDGLLARAEGHRSFGPTFRHSRLATDSEAENRYADREQASATKTTTEDGLLAHAEGHRSFGRPFRHSRFVTDSEAENRYRDREQGGEKSATISSPRRLSRNSGSSVPKDPVGDLLDFRDFVPSDPRGSPRDLGRYVTPRGDRFALAASRRQEPSIHTVVGQNQFQDRIAEGKAEMERKDNGGKIENPGSNTSQMYRESFLPQEEDETRNAKHNLEVKEQENGDLTPAMMHVSEGVHFKQGIRPTTLQGMTTQSTEISSPPMPVIAPSDSPFSVNSPNVLSSGTSPDPGPKYGDDDNDTIVDSGYGTASETSSIHPMTHLPAARDDILALIVRDSALATLFGAALRKFDAPTFQHHFGTMLGQFAKELREEAKEKSERSVAYVIRIYASYLANSIRKKFSIEVDQRAEEMDQLMRQLPHKRQLLERLLNPEFVIPEVHNNTEAPSHQAKEHDGLDDNWEENDLTLPHLERLEDFVINSHAMVNLRVKLQKWIDADDEPSDQYMEQQEATQNVTDEWAEIKDRNERQEIQNKLAQRRFRDKVREQREEFERDAENQALKPNQVERPKWTVSTLSSEQSQLKSLRNELKQIIQSVPKDQIWLSRQQNRTLINQAKAFIENSTRLEWDWWPLEPRMKLLSDSETRLFWRCSCGTRLWKEISLHEAEIVTQFLSTPGQRSPVQHRCKVKGDMKSWIGRISEFIRTRPASRASARYTPTSSAVSTSSTSQDMQNSGSDDAEIETQRQPRRQQSQIETGQLTTTVTNSAAAERTWILFGVQGSRPTLEINHIQITSQSNDSSFYRSLRRCYRDNRGRLKLWFSFWRLDYCEVVKFKKIAPKWIIKERRDLPREPEYIYAPRPPDASNPPISRHEFSMHLNACESSCRWSLLHECMPQLETNSAIACIPKKRSIYDFESPSDIYAWGLEAKHVISAAYVTVYHLIIFAIPFGLWGWWIRRHPDDMQGAAVPITVVLGLLSLFWSTNGILTQGRHAVDKEA